MIIDKIKDKIHSPMNKRLKEILALLTKYNAITSLAQQSNPENVRMCFEELGPTFIKVGQILSVRTDIVSIEFAEEFKKLQNSVPADDFSDLKPLLESEMGLSIEEVFASFDETALASASIGQIHRATLLSGEQVVVKIQHPGIFDKMSLDIGLLEKAIPLIKHSSVAAVVDPTAVVRELKKSLLQELDFINEIDNIEAFYQKNNGYESIVSPKAYREFSTSKVLIMQYFAGEKISSFIDKADALIKSGQSELVDVKKQLAGTLVRNYIKQVFEDGFFHADPHPGNLLIKTLPQGEQTETITYATTHTRYDVTQPALPYQIVYIDFGMMGTLDKSTIEKLNTVLLALSTKSSKKIATAVASLCKKSREYDKGDFEEQIGDLFEEYYEMSVEEMDIPALFSNITQICKKYGMQMPENIILLFKGLGTIEGIIEKLNPELSMMSAITPYVKKKVKHDLDLKKELMEYLHSLLLANKSLPQLPTKMMEIMDKTATGKLKVNLDHKNLEGSIKSLETMVNKLVMGMIIAALIVGSSMLIDYDSTIAGATMSTIGVIGFGIAVILAAFIFIDAYKKNKK